jgi:hypothetical protein
MLRSMEERVQRQDVMREDWRPLAAERELLTLTEAARALKVSLSTARRMLRNEPGVNVMRTPGSRRPIIRIERGVIDRLLLRSANR